MILPFDDSPLALSNEEVAMLGPDGRRERLDLLLQEADDILLHAIDEYVSRDNRIMVAIILLFSGGNDSTTLAHMFKDVATAAAHANTTIGVEQTRDFVRNTCEEWGLPLIERKPPREADRYRALVLDQGFPGPAHHYKMFQRLKERALMQVRREIITNARRQRLLFIAGRRRQESNRRAEIPAVERVDSVVWVSPLVNWTKLDLATYRLAHPDIPRNEVSDLIHMSGECLCGAFSKPNEREEIEFWFPGVFEEVAELEALLADRDDIPEHRKKWGWGARADRKDLEDASKSGRLCSSCDAGFLEAAAQMATPVEAAS